MTKRFYQGLSIVIVILIFSNSLMNAEVSSSQSGLIVSFVQSVLGWFNLSIEANTLSFIIRKLAHFLEFFALGYTMSKGWGLKTFFNFSLILIIATLDESIQLLSDGRAFGVLDIGIDLCGGIFGLFFAYLIVNHKED